MGSRISDATRARALLLSAGVALTAACAAVLGIEERPLRRDAGPSTDAGVDANAPSDPCEHVGPPAPPAKDDATDSIAPFYLAMRTLSFLGDHSAYDLDGVCTCDSRPNTAADGGPSCASPTPACDGDGGADNRAAEVFGTFRDLVNIDQLSAVNSSAANGERTVLLHVAEYNGTANDSDIRVGLMYSRGLLDGSGCGTTPKTNVDGGTPKAPPGWCGHDRWSYSQALVVPASKVPIFRVRGWVTDGKLTFASDAPISVLVGDATVAFGSPRGSGKLDKGADGIWRLSEGVLAGRVPTSDILAAIGMLPATKEPDAGRKPLCFISVFDSFKATICNQPDIRSALVADFQPGACDAYSAAVGITAEQAEVGDEFTPAPIDNACAPDRVDAGVYACP